MKRLFIFGLGYSGLAIAKLAQKNGFEVMASYRDAAKIAAMRDEGVIPVAFDDEVAIAEALRGADAVLMTASPDKSEGDPVLAAHRGAFAAIAPKWVGYLSTTSVYGDHDGAWVDEDTELAPASGRAAARQDAEKSWRETGLPVHIFRLAGIYGPGRGPLAKLRGGRTQNIVKPGQVFSRIHRDDIAGAVVASMRAPEASGNIYNLCDNEPAAPEEVLDFAASLLRMPPLERVALEDADISPMARSFYADNKRVSNDKIKNMLGYRFRYPTYREGLTADYQNWS